MEVDPKPDVPTPEVDPEQHAASKDDVDQAQNAEPLTQVVFNFYAVSKYHNIYIAISLATHKYSKAFTAAKYCNFLSRVESFTIRFPTLYP